MKKNLFFLAMLTIAASGGLATSWFLRFKGAPATASQPLRVFHHPAAFVASLTNDPQAGKKIFNEFCTSCHGRVPIIPVHAPRLGHVAEWAAYRNLDVEVLQKIISNGVRAMPARGGCFECSDRQLEQAIQYILNESK